MKDSGKIVKKKYRNILAMLDEGSGEIKWLEAKNSLDIRDSIRNAIDFLKFFGAEDKYKLLINDKVIYVDKNSKMKDVVLKYYAMDYYHKSKKGLEEFTRVDV